MQQISCICIYSISPPQRQQKPEEAGSAVEWYDLLVTYARWLIIFVKLVDRRTRWEEASVGIKEQVHHMT
jgi:hypothetical protein